MSRNDDVARTLARSCFKPLSIGLRLKIPLVPGPSRMTRFPSPSIEGEQGYRSRTLSRLYAPMDNTPPRVSHITLTNNGNSCQLKSGGTRRPSVEAANTKAFRLVFTHKSVWEAGGRWIHQQQREKVMAAIPRNSLRPRPRRRRIERRPGRTEAPAGGPGRPAPAWEPGEPGPRLRPLSGKRWSRRRRSAS